MKLSSTSSYHVAVKKTNGPRILLVKVIPQLERGADEDELG